MNEEQNKTNFFDNNTLNVPNGNNQNITPAASPVQSQSNNIDQGQPMTMSSLVNQNNQNTMVQSDLYVNNMIDNNNQNIAQDVSSIQPKNIDMNQEQPMTMSSLVNQNNQNTMVQPDLSVNNMIDNNSQNIIPDVSPIQPQNIDMNQGQPMTMSGLVNQNSQNTMVQPDLSVNNMVADNNNQNITLGVSPIQPQNIDMNQGQNNNIIQEGNTQDSGNQTINEGVTTQNNSNLTDDEQLLKAFIGKNYDKITTKQFNFAGFFLTTFYMFYRKMFLYALLIFLVDLIILNFTNMSYLTLLTNVAVGLMINKMYVSYAKKKITKIKSKNSQVSMAELSNICAKKGGTSVAQIFLGFLAELGISVVVIVLMMVMGLGSIVSQFMNIGGMNTFDNKVELETGDLTISTDGTLLEDGLVNGYSCIDTLCYIMIEKNGSTDNYAINSTSGEVVRALDDYGEYVILNIYYKKKSGKNVISGYKILLRSSNEDISYVRTEDELRDKIGLYSSGIHTDSFTLKEIGMDGFATIDGKSYNTTEYYFVNDKNVTCKMIYLNPDSSLKYTEGDKYSVTFEVKKTTFGYNIYIKSIS